jgi:hypothetical protein
LLFIAGQFSLKIGQLKYPAQIGRDHSRGDSYEGAQRAAPNVLVHIRYGK